MARFFSELKISCDTKGAAMPSRSAKRLKKIVCILTSGFRGPGRSAFQVRVAGPVPIFACIYDKGWYYHTKTRNCF